MLIVLLIIFYKFVDYVGKFFVNGFGVLRRFFVVVICYRGIIFILIFVVKLNIKDKKFIFFLLGVIC